MAAPLTFTVSFEEVGESPTFSGNESGPVATRHFKCAWADAQSLVTQWCGTTYLSGTSYVLAQPNGFYAPGNVWIVAKSYEIKPFTDTPVHTGDAMAITPNTYAYADVTIGYAAPDVNQYADANGNEVYASESLEPFVDFLQLPSSTFFWSGSTAASPKPFPDSMEIPRVILTGFTYTYTRYKMSQVPSSVLSFVGNYVNSETIYSPKLNFTFPVETLLYAPPTIDDDILVNGTQLYKVTIKLMYRTQGWNKYWNPALAGGDGNWDTITISNTGAPQYKSYTPKNFAPLFNS